MSVVEYRRSFGNVLDEVAVVAYEVCVDLREVEHCEREVGVFRYEGNFVSKAVVDDFYLFPCVDVYPPACCDIVICFHRAFVGRVFNVPFEVVGMEFSFHDIEIVSLFAE